MNKVVGRLAQWKNVRFIKSFVSSDHGSNLAVHQSLFHVRLIIRIICMIPRLQKYVGREPRNLVWNQNYCGRNTQPLSERERSLNKSTLWNMGFQEVGS